MLDAVKFRYYIFMSLFIFLIFSYKSEISDCLLSFTGLNIHPINLVIIVNIILLIYIPLAYLAITLVAHMCMKDYNNDGKPDLMFMDPYEYWKLIHKR